MTPASPLAASVAVLGIVGLLTVPAPAIAAPASCVIAGSFAAQSGAELIRLDKLEVRRIGGRTSDKVRGATGGFSAGNSKQAKSSAGGSADAVGGSERRGANDGRTSLGGLMLGRVDDQPAAGSGDVAAVIAGAGSGTVRARKPAGPGSTDADFSGQPTGMSTDRADMPAPQPTTASGQDRGEEEAGGAGKGGDTTAVVRDLRVGEAKSALVATAEPTAAAVTRMVNSSQQPRLSKPLIQQAPPANDGPARQDTPAAEVGPLLLDAGLLTSRARSACVTDGGATRAATTLGAAAVLDTLVVVPVKMESLSTTTVERRGPGASASIAARTVELLDGAVHLKVVRSPRLTTSMSAAGGEVRYTPAELEVFGEGIKKTTLNAAGDRMEMTFSDRTESAARPAPEDVSLGPALPLPRIPGIPVLDAGGPEAAPARGAGTTVTVSLGKVRRAAEENAVAARVSAIEIGISEQGYGTGVTLDMDLGVLESATVAAKPRDGVSGAGGGLPVTGPGVGMLAQGGAGLLLAGVAAVAFGMRRRRFRA